MKAEDAKVGDKVIVLRDAWVSHTGYIDYDKFGEGTIARIATSGNSAAVEFKHPIPNYSNDCHGSCNPGYGKYIVWECLELKEKPKDKSTIYGFKKGDTVRFNRDVYLSIISDTVQVGTFANVHTVTSNGVVVDLNHSIKGLFSVPADSICVVPQTESAIREFKYGDIIVFDRDVQTLKSKVMKGTRAKVFSEHEDAGSVIVELDYGYHYVIPRDAIRFLDEVEIEEDRRKEAYQRAAIEQYLQKPLTPLEAFDIPVKYKSDSFIATGFGMKYGGIKYDTWGQESKKKRRLACIKLLR